MMDASSIIDHASRRKGTATSCEIALIECPSESKSSTNINNIANIIRLTLLEATDPGFKVRKLLEQ